MGIASFVVQVLIALGTVGATVVGFYAIRSARRSNDKTLRVGKLEELYTLTSSIEEKIRIFVTAESNWRASISVSKLPHETSIKGEQEAAENKKIKEELKADLVGVVNRIEILLELYLPKTLNGHQTFIPSIRRTIDENFEEKSQYLDNIKSEQAIILAEVKNEMLNASSKPTSIDKLGTPRVNDNHETKDAKSSEDERKSTKVDFGRLLKSTYQWINKNKGWILPLLFACSILRDYIYYRSYGINIFTYATIQDTAIDFFINMWPVFLLVLLFPILFFMPNLGEGKGLRSNMSYKILSCVIAIFVFVLMFLSGRVVFITIIIVLLFVMLGFSFREKETFIWLAFCSVSVFVVLCLMPLRHQRNDSVKDKTTLDLFSFTYEGNFIDCQKDQYYPIGSSSLYFFIQDYSDSTTLVIPKSECKHITIHHSEDFLFNLKANSNMLMNLGLSLLYMILYIWLLVGANHKREELTNRIINKFPNKQD